MAEILKHFTPTEGWWSATSEYLRLQVLRVAAHKRRCEHVTARWNDAEAFAAVLSNPRAVSEVPSMYLPSIRIADTSADADVSVESAPTLSTQDPLSMKPIVTPVRSTVCHPHLQCFDLHYFLMYCAKQMGARGGGAAPPAATDPQSELFGFTAQVHEKKVPVAGNASLASFRCPVCNSVVTLQSIYLDKFIQDAMKQHPAALLLTIDPPSGRFSVLKERDPDDETDSDSDAADELAKPSATPDGLQSATRKRRRSEDAGCTPNGATPPLSARKK